jgi:cell division protein FtsQ
MAAIVLAACAVAGGLYAAALDTSMFALHTLDIRGGTPAVDAQVRAALAPEMGESLLRVSGAAVDRAAASLPDVVSLRFVRSFPHTLRVYVTPERPVLLIRRGGAGFVVSARGRVMAESGRPLASALPRMWVPRGTPLGVGETLGRANGLLAAAAAGALGPRTIPGGVRFLTVVAGQITLITPSGFQIRLGDNGQLALKLTIAARIMAYLGANLASDGYVDVSVPERPVVGTQLSSRR